MGGAGLDHVGPGRQHPQGVSRSGCRVRRPGPQDPDGVVWYDRSPVDRRRHHPASRVQLDRPFAADTHGSFVSPPGFRTGDRWYGAVPASIVRGLARGGGAFLVADGGVIHRLDCADLSHAGVVRYVPVDLGRPDPAHRPLLERPRAIRGGDLVVSQSGPELQWLSLPSAAVVSGRSLVVFGGLCVATRWPEKALGHPGKLADHRRSRGCHRAMVPTTSTDQASGREGPWRRSDAALLMALWLRRCWSCWRRRCWPGPSNR